MKQNISIFGAGYVGSVSAGCLAKLGHKVIIVDLVKTKIDIINEGKSHIVEKGLDLLISNGVKDKLIEASQSTKYAILNTNVSFICVGTPSTKQGGLNLDHVLSVVKEIGEALKEKNDFHVIALRSTILPGTVEKCISIIESVSNKKYLKDFSVCSNPEFLREGTAIEDYFNPPYTLIGSEDEKALTIMKGIYEELNAPLYATEIKVAEILKYINNSFHALKVSFANEVGVIAKSFGIDSHKLMEIFVKDDKLNISPYYLKPGFAFGGSCLPKDLKAICYYAKQNDIDIPVLSNVMHSNENHIKTGIDMIISEKKKNIGVIGLSFKPDTDDLRESPIVLLLETLLGKGFKIKIYDKNVSLAKIYGSNKDYLEKHIPHISELITEDFDELVNFADVITIGNKEKDLIDKLKDIINNTDKIVIDFVRIDQNLVSKGNYHGICW